MDERMIAIAVDILKIDVETAKRTAKHLPELNAYMFCNPIRGGGVVIVNDQGEKLAAGSSVSPKSLKESFAQGKRN